MPAKPHVFSENDPWPFSGTVMGKICHACNSETGYFLALWAGSITRLRLMTMFAKDREWKLFPFSRKKNNRENVQDVAGIEKFWAETTVLSRHKSLQRLSQKACWLLMPSVFLCVCPSSRHTRAQLISVMLLPFLTETALDNFEAIRFLQALWHVPSHLIQTQSCWASSLTWLFTTPEIIHI